MSNDFTVKVHLEDGRLVSKLGFFDYSIEFRWRFDGSNLQPLSPLFHTDGVQAELNDEWQVVGLRTGEGRHRYWDATTVAGSKWKPYWSNIERQYALLMEYANIQEAAENAAIEFLKGFLNAIR